MIYLDNAATSLLKPPEVAEAVCRAMGSAGNSGRGAHAAALAAAREIFGVRQKIAEWFGALDASWTAFACNATEALNTAIFGTILPEEHPHVITTELEHNSVLRPLYLLESKGVRLTILKADEKGNFSYRELEEAVCKDTKAIVCTHASNVTGNVTDIKRIGQLARERGILFIVDASQSAGVLPIHMQEDGIDILCFSGHKGLFGPQGTGVLIKRPEIAVRPLKVGGSGIATFSRTHPDTMPAALEAGTLNAPGIAGLGAGLDFVKRVGQDKIHQRENRLAERFYQGVRNIPGIRLYGDFESEARTAVVTLNLGCLDSAAVCDELMECYGICTRSGGHCAPLMHQAFGTVQQGAVRFSFSYFNTDAEIDAAIDALDRMSREK